MTSPAGWHPDPHPQQSGQPQQLRYWDGATWTEHTAPVPVYSAPIKATTTPDGAPLANWWQRVGATVIDGLIVGPITAAICYPFYAKVFDVYRAYFDEIGASIENGTSGPSPFKLQVDLFGTIVQIGLIGLVLGLVWTCFWLRWKQATPGKLALGLRIRLRETPGRLPWNTIGLRWLGQSGVGLLGLVPFVGSLTGLYSLLDALWPLWDDHRQAIHDKIAKTNVVRVR